jgi:hypothetical protein
MPVVEDRRKNPSQFGHGSRSNIHPTEPTAPPAKNNDGPKLGRDGRPVIEDNRNKSKSFTSMFKSKPKANNSGGKTVATL